MSATTVVLQGTVKPDGTLELDGKVPLPPGKVSVTLQLVPALPEWLEKLDLPKDDPFFDMLRRIWAIREKDGVKPDAEAAIAAARKVRDEFDEQVEAVGRLQEECRRRREEAEVAAREGG